MPPRYRDPSTPPTVVRVYTICDESRYLIVRNIPALGCGDDLFKLFASYGDVEEQDQIPPDQQCQLEEPRVPKFITWALRARLHCLHHRLTTFLSTSTLINLGRDSGESQNVHQTGDPPVTRVSSGQDYFPAQSMNQTVRLAREKFNKIQSSSYSSIYKPGLHPRSTS